MKLRTLLATAVASTLVAGVGGTSALAARAPSPAAAGTVTAWGSASAAADAISVPVDLATPVAKVAANGRASAAVTADGKLRVWGPSTAAEVSEAPTDLTNVTTVALVMNAGAALQSNGVVTAWGGNPTFTQTVPEDLRAKAISITPNGTGYAVKTDGTVTTWGAAPGAPTPAGLSNVVDVVSGSFHAAVLHANGTVTAWGYESAEEEVTGFNATPDFGGKKVVQIAAGTYSFGAVLEDGTYKTWGWMPIAGEPDLTGQKVISLDMANMGAAVTDDGVVHLWGAGPDVAAVPASLTGQPVNSVVVGAQHAVALTTVFRDITQPTIRGTAQAGKSLTATPATFSLTPDAPATGQWYAGTAPIAGATGTTLALSSAHVGKTISYRTTATRGTQTITSKSASTSAVKAAPVVKAKAKVSVAVKASGKTPKIAKRVVLTVTVKTTPKTNPQGKVTITFKGKTTKKVTAKINKQGKATVTLKKVKRGSYTITVKYAGNAKTKSASTTKKAKI